MLAALILVIVVHKDFFFKSIHMQEIPVGVKSLSERLLSSIIASSEPNGLFKEDVTSFSLGTQIFSYELKNNSLEPLETHLYPIFNQNSKLITMLLCKINSDGSWSGNLSTAFAHELPLEWTQNTAFALIYDANFLYVYNGTNLFSISENFVFVEARGLISDLSQREQISLLKKVRLSVVEPQIQLSVSLGPSR